MHIRTGHSPENLSIVRKMAKAMLQHDTLKLSISRKMRRAAMIDEYAASVIDSKRGDPGLYKKNN